MRVPRKDHPCHRRGRACLLAPSTTRTPPAETLQPVVSNVRFADSIIGFLIEPGRVGPRSRRGILSTIIYHGTTQKQPRASWCVTNTDTQTITPLRRCRLNLYLRLSAWHTTRMRRDPRRGPRFRHAHRTHGARVGRDARRRTRRASYFGSSSSRRRRWCVQAIQELAEMPQPTENEAGLTAPRPARCSCEVCIWGFKNVLGGLFPLRCGRWPARRVRAFELRIRWIEDEIKQEKLALISVPTRQMVADVLTKSLSYETFARHSSYPKGVIFPELEKKTKRTRLE